MENQKLMQEITSLLKKKADSLILESRNYQEALEKARASRLSYKYGKLGSELDIYISDYIKSKAYHQLIN